ncbi:FtsB family cell division protein [Desulfonatronovibrio magnus]|uniref:FtsB family cell division protein n=1 Tax=Desulfonatronovibrio magnus TaxID=698827 RepID=UPI0005EBE185|nr:septum formation initiator family protein [Desulfonatronovibrio magnus]RQD64531.1 MAG: septum formation initiator family protein [Desulfonatronovibrio sp. MSAO_Bac4]
MYRLIIILLLILNAFMIHKLIWTPSGVLNYLEINESYLELEQRNNALIEENRELSRQIMALREDDDYLMEAVRREMRYVKDNEVLYFFSP